MPVKNHHKNFALAAFVAVTALYSVQGSAATATATASATISDAPIAITNTQPLSFGEISAGDQASTITLAADGTRTLASGNAVLGATAGSAATFDVTGESNKAFTINLPTTPVTLSDGGTNTMTVSNFVSDAGATPALDASGAATFNVGAELAVAANQAAGSYSGSFTVEVVY